MSVLYYEDFHQGQVFDTRSYPVSAEEIIAFGKQYAPLAYHTDAEAAKATAFGGLVAAGYQTASITFRLVVDTGILASSMGSPGIDKMRWLRPVRPGDALRVRIEIAELMPAGPERKRDALKIRYTTLNQDDEKVMTLESVHMIKRREAPPA